MDIFLIEDDKRLAHTIGDVLESVGMTPHYCYNGQQGLEQGLPLEYGR